ncbi:hypothetical protein NEOLEDRAFT_1136379 [Neolentinus lepideus HHB14362 ss-1]|uniref:Microbial-type PARG catalytic domain-containing protein n=1 Tax=Neolentinus lepideus HHB14362 ss-1 TaxID=1314782 RepID=A0A165RBS5_9AGAM|nr:hypothetical protein NEOLEDRAFT_1136379 [Neolentinus lepideus HHB14362 ss-1]
MANRKSNRRALGSRRQRSVTPTLPHKQGPDKHRDSQKRHMKKQQQIEFRKRKLAGEAMKKKRERWAQIALETQRIVLGDGKYVEERNVSSDSREMTVQGLGAHIIMPVNFQRIGVTHDISMQILLSKQQTVSYPHQSDFLAGWVTSHPPSFHPRPSTIIEFTQCSALTAARRLHTVFPELHDHNPSTLDKTRIGVLSFASPKRPGGGYINGGDEQEELIARSSSLVAALSSPQAAEFYRTHRQFKNEDGSGLYDHAMVYSPGVVVFRKEDEELEEQPEAPLTGGRRKRKRNGSTISQSLDTSGAFIEPFLVNVVSAVPVNAAAFLRKHTVAPADQERVSAEIRRAMRDRMGRVLRCFEERGDKAIVLGAFGGGSSECNPDMIADVWAELFVTGDRRQGTDSPKRTDARFKDVFERIVFAVPGKWFADFKQSFELRMLETEIETVMMSQNDEC